MLTDKARQATQDVVEPIALALGRAGLSPNGITVLGLLQHVGVAWLLGRGHFLAGGLLLAFAAAFDGLDGTLARALGTASWRGAFLDSVLDRGSEILTFGGLIYFYAAGADAGSVMLGLAALTGSLMVSYTRARSEGLDHGTKVGVFGRLERMIVLVLGLVVGVPVLTMTIIAVGAWLTTGHRMYDVLTKDDAAAP